MYAGAHDVFEDVVHDGVVRAAEDECVGGEVLDGGEVFFQNGASFGFVVPAFFDEWDEEWAGLSKSFNIGVELVKFFFVGLGVDRGAGSDDGDTFIFGYFDRLFSDGDYDAQDFPICDVWSSEILFLQVG